MNELVNLIVNNIKKELNGVADKEKMLDLLELRARIELCMEDEMPDMPELERIFA